MPCRSNSLTGTVATELARRRRRGGLRRLPAFRGRLVRERLSSPPQLLDFGDELLETGFEIVRGSARCSPRCRTERSDEGDEVAHPLAGKLIPEGRHLAP